MLDVKGPLTHWGRVTHICVSNLTIIGSHNGLSPRRRQAIIWTNDGILLIGPSGTNFSGILIGIQTFSFKKMHLKMASAKWRPFVSASMSQISAQKSNNTQYKVWGEIAYPFSNGNDAEKKCAYCMIYINQLLNLSKYMANRHTTSKLRDQMISLFPFLRFRSALWYLSFFNRVSERNERFSHCMCIFLCSTVRLANVLMIDTLRPRQMADIMKATFSNSLYWMKTLWRFTERTGPHKKVQIWWKMKWTVC